MEDNSRLVHVGTPKEMFAKLKQIQSEKQQLEKKAENLTREKNILNRDVASLQKVLTENEQTIGDLRKDNERLRLVELSKVSDKSRFTELESQNSQLQTSLVDIANTVLDDLDAIDTANNQSEIMITSTPIIKSRSMRFGVQLKSVKTCLVIYLFFPVAPGLSDQRMMLKTELIREPVLSLQQWLILQ